MTKTSHATFTERRSANLLASTQRALWPLVKLLLHRGVTYPSLAEVMKTVFIHVAQSEFPLQGKRETDSRVSLLTGIHRRDVKRLRDAARAPEQRSTASMPTADEDGQAVTATEISLSARVIAFWTGLPEYLDATGKPRPLARLARNDAEASFESLVRSVSKDIRPRALLDEWVRRGAVTIDDDDRVCLNLDVFMAHKALDERAFYLGQNVHDHLAAIAHNITGGKPPFLERCVFYRGLTQQSVDELEKLAREEGMKALQIVNRRAMELKAQDAGKAEARVRMNFGLYFYSAGPRPQSGAHTGSEDTDE
jgi:hypothetical protein